MQSIQWALDIKFEILVPYREPRSVDDFRLCLYVRRSVAFWCMHNVHKWVRQRIVVHRWQVPALACQRACRVVAQEEQCSKRGGNVRGQHLPDPTWISTNFAFFAFFGMTACMPPVAVPQSPPCNCRFPCNQFGGSLSTPVITRRHWDIVTLLPAKIFMHIFKKQRRLGYSVRRQDFVSYVCFLATCFLLDSGHDAGVCAHARMHIQGLWMPQPNREHGDHIAVPRCGSMHVLQRTE